MCNEKQNKKLHVNWSVNSPVWNTAGVWTVQYQTLMRTKALLFRYGIK
jgi:hypothetical protein